MNIGGIVKKKIFFAIFIPYFLLLIIIFGLYLACRANYSLSVTETTLRDAFSVVKENSLYIIQNFENYENRLKKKVSNYEIGTFFYVWLLRTNGEEVAVSLNKSQNDPDELQTNRDLFINKIKSNQPYGYYSDKSDKNYKFVIYSALEPTDLVIACVADIPKSSVAQADGLDIKLILFFLTLLALGLFASIWLLLFLLATSCYIIL